MKLWSNNNVARGNGGFNPERRLLSAILQRAITDFVSGEGELQESAKDWLFLGDDPGEFFGFAYICEALDFHREELRKAVRKQREQFVGDQGLGEVIADRSVSVAA
jgi:hypothetical protein